MRKYLIPTLAAAAVISGPIHAQEQSAEDALVSSFEAEHSVWKEDVERWDDEHEEAIAVLQDAIDKLSEESALDRHRESIGGHSASLSGNDLAGMADHHARVRSQHEEMREVHHHLMDSVAMIEKALEEDASVINEDAHETQTESEQ